MDKVFFGILIFAMGVLVGCYLIETITDISAKTIVAPEEVSLIPVKLTIHTAKGAMTYYPAPKSENVDDKVRYWFYPDDADIYAISVSCEKEASGE